MHLTPHAVIRTRSSMLLVGGDIMLLLPASELKAHSLPRKYLLETISNKRKIKEKIDSVSAVLILENYLASKGRL